MFETKIVVYNTGLLYPRIRISVNKAGIFSLSFTQCNISQPMDFFEFFNVYCV